jgi:hypothetical protein
LSATIGFPVVRSGVVMLLVASLAISACGGSSNDDNSGAPAVGVSQITVPNQPASNDHYTAAQRFQISKQTCEFHKPKGMKFDYGITGRSRAEIARNWSLKAPPQFRKVALDGCLAGFAAESKK